MADDPHILPFASRAGRGSGNGQEPPDDEEVAAGDAFAVARGSRAPTTLKFLLRDGKTLAMAYAYHPIVWGQSPELVLLEYPGLFTVMLAGERLGLLQEKLCDYRVTWIREGDDDQAASLTARVTRIERLKSYPSREFEGAVSGN